MEVTSARQRLTETWLLEHYFRSLPRLSQASSRPLLLPQPILRLLGTAAFPSLPIRGSLPGPQ